VPLILPERPSDCLIAIYCRACSSLVFVLYERRLVAAWYGSHAITRTGREGWQIIAVGMRSRWSPTTKRAVVVAFAALAVLIVWRAGDIVEPFVWAAILSYILLPLVAAIQRRIGFGRTAAALFVFLGVLAVIFGGGRLLVPRLADNAHDLQQTWPALFANARQTISDTFDQIGLGDLDDALIGPNLQDLERQLQTMASRNALPFVVGAGHFLLQFLIFLIGTFLMLRDAPRLLSAIQWEG
jgi:predicted PurR-regulated permease PerM